MPAGVGAGCDNGSMAAPTLDRARPVSVVRPPRVGSARTNRTAVHRRRPGLATAVAMSACALLLLPVLVVVGSYWHVSAAAQMHDPTPTDALVVLGAAQFDGKPSPVLRARLDHARGLWRDGVAPRIITVGGKQPTDRHTEAEAGRNWLVAQGVDAGGVVALGTGTDTVSSLQAVAELAHESGWESVTLVSDPAHMARTEAIANRLGLDAHVNSTVRGDGSEATVSYLARETAGYLNFEFVEQWQLLAVGDDSQ